MRAAFAVLALFVLIGAGAARAAVARPTTVEALARGSEAVVRGSVVSREARWSEDGRHIVTLVTIDRTATIRGGAPDRIVVRVPGGEVGGIGQRVAGAPQFADREDVVIFLRRDVSGAYRVNGLGLGKFRVDRGGDAIPALDGMHVLAGEVPAGERRVEAMPLADLERRVRSAR